MLGAGIVKGMMVTAKNFFGSYLNDERLVTVEYPEERLPQIENARNFPFLVYDGDNPAKGLRCVACQICEAECPPKCIYIVKDKAKKADYTGRLQYQPAVFDIDISVCMSCQICVEVCPFDAIKMDVEFELSNPDRFGGLLWRKDQLTKSNDYYRKIHPAEAAEVDERMAKQAARADAKSQELAAKLAAASSPSGLPATEPSGPSLKNA